MNSIHLPKQPILNLNTGASNSGFSNSTISKMISSSDMTIVVLDDQLVNLEATKLLLIEFGFKGQIKLFISSLAAINFIMTYTLENKGQKTIDLLITEFKMPERSGIDVI